MTGRERHGALDPSEERRRAKVRRFAGNWSELHRQEDEARHASTPFQVMREVPGRIVVAAVGGVLALALRTPPSLLQLLAIGAAGAGGAAWVGFALMRRRQLRAAERVLFDREASRARRGRQREKRAIESPREP